MTDQELASILLARFRSASELQYFLALDIWPAMQKRKLANSPRALARQAKAAEEKAENERKWEEFRKKTQPNSTPEQFAAWRRKNQC